MLVGAATGHPVQVADTSRAGVIASMPGSDRDPDVRYVAAHATSNMTDYLGREPRTSVWG